MSNEIDSFPNLCPPINSWPIKHRFSSWFLALEQRKHVMKRTLAKFREKNSFSLSLASLRTLIELVNEVHEIIDAAEAEAEQNYWTCLICAQCGLFTLIADLGENERHRVSPRFLLTLYFLISEVDGKAPLDFVKTCYIFGHPSFLQMCYISGCLFEWLPISNVPRLT